MSDTNLKQLDYFNLRHIDSPGEEFFPRYLNDVLINPTAPVLDIGCGTGKLLRALRSRHFESIYGVDINPEAIEYCQSDNLPVELIESIELYSENNQEKFEVIILQHVIEHIPKEQIIPTLSHIRKMLTTTGQLIIAVPNAQSSTGCYWAYEDFTHTTLFTSGSLKFVLQAAGFSHVRFIDPDCTAGLPAWKRVVKKALLSIYKLRISFWNQITNSSFHLPSEQLFSYEIKAEARH